MQYTLIAVQTSVVYTNSASSSNSVSFIRLELMPLYIWEEKKSCYIIKNLDFSV